MKIDELQEFLIILEDIATYCHMTFDEKDFSNKIKIIKDLFKKSGMEVPIEIKMTKKPYDYRSELQKFGGYKERRERIKETFYPLLDYLENKSDFLNSKDQFTQGKLNDHLRLNNYTIKTLYGSISNISISETAADGNGIVYFGKLNNHDVAIKFLLKNDKNKKNRFLCEFFNVLIGFENNEGIVKQYFYEEVLIDNVKVPIIVMKKYSNHLEYVDNIEQDSLIDIFNQLAQALKKVHDNGIIHRDLKPKNILIDEKGRLNIADFGISYYNSELYDMTGHTQKGERLANFEFSAPEQSNSSKEVTAAADIYSLGQIIYWLVFNETCKGTRRKKITDKYNGPRMELLDSIIDKCIATDPKDRYQSIDEIYDFIKTKKLPTGEIDSKLVIKKDNQEIKEQLKDIIEHITFITTEDKTGEKIRTTTFKMMEKLTDEKIIMFLGKMKFKQQELLFSDKVTISDYFEEYDNTFYEEYYLKKEYFTDLSQLYNEIKDDESLYLPFIKYIKKVFNDNCIEELPF